MVTDKSIDPLLQYLFGLERKGIKVGLGHTKELLKRCQHPEDTFRAIHVAGTNGKGSTCTMIASMLREQGLTVGLYTSPHLIKFNERIRVNGIPISDNDIIDFVQQHQHDIEEIQSTFFETTTAMAFSYFKQCRVDVAVIETGLGGRLDSTNVIVPEITVITPIGMDHTEFLGDTLTSISGEKAGIIKPSTPLILAEQQREAEHVILKTAKERFAPIHQVKQKDLRIIQTGLNGTEFLYQNETFVTPLLGEYQALNTATAISTVREFIPDIASETINAGLQKTQWPGRIQRLSSDRPIYYDVAHNEHGIQAVLRWLKNQYTEKPVGVFVLKADKELQKMHSILSEGFSSLIVTSCPETGLMSADALEASMSQVRIPTIRDDEFIHAIQRLEETISDDKPGLIFGSHYIATAVYERFGFFFDKGII